MGHLVGKSFGRYQLLEQVGEGGMATVYKAYDTRLDRPVAVKVINASLQTAENFLKRFEREAKALAQLSHPHIVKVYDYGEEAGNPYLVMEYLPGGTLKQRMSGRPMPYAEAARMIAPIARALAYAHKLGILHRDVKPANILFGESDAPMLSDFGIAKMLESKDSMQLTGAGVGIGTPEYVAPEQGMGYGADYRSDIYSLGVVYYELITGRKPFHADTPMAVVLKHITEPLPRPRQFVPQIPEEAENVLFKALAKKPEERYQDMESFAKALEGLYLSAPTDAAIGKGMEAETVIQEQATIVQAPGRMEPLPEPKYQMPMQPTAAAPQSSQSYPAYSSQPYPSAPAPAYPSAPAWQEAPLPKKKSAAGWIIGGGLLLLICFAATVVGGYLLLKPSSTPTREVGSSREETATEEVLEEETSTPSPEPVSSWVGNIDQARDAFNRGVLSLGDLELNEYADDAYAQINDPLQFNVLLKEREEVLWISNWCTTTQAILTDNIAKMEFIFRIEDVEVPADRVVSETYTSGSGYACIRKYILLQNFEAGRYDLVEEMLFKESLNDGWNDYAQGSLIRHYTVSVKTENQLQEELNACATGIDRTSLMDYQGGEALYCRQFNDMMEAMTGFTSGPYGDLTTDISDGKYRMYVHSIDGVIYYRTLLYDTNSLNRYGVTVDIRRSGGTTSSEYGIAFHYDDDTMACYYFSIKDAAQTYSVYLYNNGWQQILADTFEEGIRPDEVNQLAVLADGSSYRLVINGKQVYTFEDTRLSGGAIALAASVLSQGESADYEFDNLLLVSP